MATRRRLDAELVEQGFFQTKDDAMRSVLAGEVSTTDRRLEHPGEQVRQGIELHVRGRSPYVSRGGIKLAGGLDAFRVDVVGLDCLDVGCSTGGFTDCLLRRGASSVLAVDVGYAQFDWGLRQDPRVRLLERTNICDVPTIVDAASIDLAVSDVSFTSVLTIAPAVHTLLKPGGRFLTLVKPQFEADRDEVNAGGIVRDASVRKRVLDQVKAGLSDLGFTIDAETTSPIKGHKGNVEYLLLVHVEPQ